MVDALGLGPPLLAGVAPARLVVAIAPDGDDPVAVDVDLDATEDVAEPAEGLLGLDQGGRSSIAEVTRMPLRLADARGGSARSWAIRRAVPAK